MEDASAAFERILVMGNGGTGKAWLAHRLRTRLCHTVIHLDDMHWERRTHFLLNFTKNFVS
ncbi:hypothetical protein ACDY96_30900 [Rhizobium mongolense]|uniref:hypothetical protein n=1 Tax=Rhizobium mongolense TaxID=57676 RepID=UPI0035592D42